MLQLLGNCFSGKKIPAKIINMGLRVIVYRQNEELYDKCMIAI